MLLAIDAGNTNIVFALFDGANLRGHWRITTNAARTADEYAVFLHSLMQKSGISPSMVKAAILGSVVPEANFHLIRLCRDHFGCDPMVVGAGGVDAGIKILLDRPEEIGADRIINAVGALQKYKVPLLIIDFGTATTFDVVDESGAYVGGAISPGINLSLQALHQAAAKLPRIGVAKPRNVVGKNTVEALQSGIFWGYAGLIEGMVKRIQQGFERPLTVIATGGLAPLFAEHVPVISNLDDDLTLHGLRLIFERNQNSKG